MTQWTAGLCVGLALILSVGCGGGGNNVTVPLAVTLAPTAVTALVGSFVQFAVAVNANVDSLTYSVNDVVGGNATVGTITTDGLYQAPAVVPAGTTITVKAHAADSTTGSSADATATVTLDSGVRVSISSGSSFTIGTGETFPFAASVIGVPQTASVSGVCDNITNTPVSCKAVTWSVAGVGSIDSGSGLFTAPGSLTATTGTITATSVYDSTRTATATVTIVDITATPPTLTSISNTSGAAGALFQDVYLTGSNFISTTNVFLNGVQIPTSQIVRSSSTLLRVRIPDSALANAGTFPFTVAQQVGSPQVCADPTQCQITLSAVRPVIVGGAADAIRQPNGTTPAVDVTLDGGYFGSPTVTGQYNGQGRTTSVNSARRLSVTVGGAGNPGDLNTPGSFPVTVQNSAAAQPQTVTNVAVQPTYPASAITELAGSPIAAGTAPSAIAVNTTTGIAVVANRGSNSVALIDLATVARLGFICTGDPGATLVVSDAGCATPSNPVSVAIDNLGNRALVANAGNNLTTCNSSTSCSVAVINLTTRTVDTIIPASATNIAKVPSGIGVNPISGLAIVAYRSTNFASIIDLTVTPPAVTGIVRVATGVSPRVAVSPKLNWAVVTPGDTGGGGGVVALVDLARQTRNAIASANCSGSTVTVSTATPHTLSPGDPVLITGSTGTAINGVFQVVSTPGSTSFTYTSSGCASGTGGTANYAPFLASVALSTSVTGVAFNDETQNAILVDPTGPQAFLFSALDQVSSTVPPGLNLTGNIAGAFNPLTDVAVTVNRLTNDAAVIDPVTPAVLTTFAVGTEPMDVAIDPSTKTAVIANRTSNNVSIFSLGDQRTPQILQVSRTEVGTGVPRPAEFELTSTLSAAPSGVVDQTLRVIGSGFAGGTTIARLDGVNLATSVVSNRELTAVVPAAMLTTGPRLYALDVTNGAAVSNAATFTVVQSVDMSGLNCLPQAVAIDSRRNLAVVTNSGCNLAAIVNLPNATTGATGTGQTVPVGTNPQGVAVHLQSGLAVVANQDSNNASIVDLSAGSVVATVANIPGPIGVAIDPALGTAVVTANSANEINTFAVSATPDTPTIFPVQVRPVAIAIDPDRHLAAVANTTSNTVSLVDLTQAAATEHIPANGLPAGIAFDPISTAFLSIQSLANQLLLLDPVSRSTTGLRIGINPTSIAYNFNSSTLVTTNSSSQTMSVIDFLSGRVRAVLHVNASGRFAVDIHPFTNLAVIADSTNKKIYLRPLPR